MRVLGSFFIGLTALCLPGASCLAQAVTKDAIVIGQSAALSGSQAEFGKDIRDGAVAYFDMVNQQGGVNGRRIQLVSLDDGGSEAKAKENTNALVNEQKAIALFGYISRPSAIAGAKVASDAKV